MKTSSVGCLLHTQSAIYPLQQSLSNHDHSDSAGETDNDRLKKKKKKNWKKKKMSTQVWLAPLKAALLRQAAITSKLQHLEVPN